EDTVEIGGVVRDEFDPGANGFGDRPHQGDVESGVVRDPVEGRIGEGGADSQCLHGLTVVVRVLFAPARFGRMRMRLWRPCSSLPLFERAIHICERRGHREGERWWS